MFIVSLLDHGSVDNPPLPFMRPLPLWNCDVGFSGAPTHTGANGRVRYAAPSALPLPHFTLSRQRSTTYSSAHLLPAVKGASPGTA